MQSSLTGFFSTTGVEGLDLDFAAGEGRSSKSPNTGAISGVLRIWTEIICTSIAGGNVSAHLLHALGVALSFQLVFSGKSRMILK